MQYYKHGRSILKSNNQLQKFINKKLSTSTKRVSLFLVKNNQIYFFFFNFILSVMRIEEKRNQTSAESLIINDTDFTYFV